MCRCTLNNSNNRKSQKKETCTKKNNKQKTHLTDHRSDVSWSELAERKTTSIHPVVHSYFRSVCAWVCVWAKQKQLTVCHQGQPCPNHLLHV